MIGINIQVEDLQQDFLLSDEEVKGLISHVVSGVTNIAKNKWEEFAKSSLKSTREQYIRSLVIGDEGIYVGYVVLTGVFNNMIEQGADPFDMKEGFSHAKNVKIKKDGGWYMSVPMRYANPEALAENPAFSGKMPKGVYEVTKAQPVKKAVKLEQLPKINQEKGVRNEIKTNKGVTFKKYEHKTPIFQGIVRTEVPTPEGTKLKGGAKHSQYMSFRTVSDNSDPDSWIHPGFEPSNFKDKAIESMNIFSLTGLLIDQYLETIR